VRGYFADEGLNDVVIARANDPVGDLASGDTDIAVVRYKDVESLVKDAPGTTAIAGYQNYAGKDGAYGGDALMAGPGLVQHDPATVIAFLKAYVRALQDLGDADTASAALEEIAEQTDLAVDAALIERWPAATTRYGPFDGGFGAVAEEDGVGELTALLRGRADDDPDVSPFITAYPLNLAQVSLGLPRNPANALIAAPGVTDIRIGLPGGSAAISPINVADAGGYFADIGFDSVEIVDVERALAGVMVGQLDLAIVDLQDAADGIVQGLPLRAVAGHLNYPDGIHGGDVLVASPDLIAEEGATVAAFLVAYVRGLQDLTESVEATGFAPFDGGYGDRADGGGLDELAASLRDRAGRGAGVKALVVEEPLLVAQAWWGLPSNPTSVPPPEVAATATDDTSEGAA
jgi:ABC-type nitrate/sulfonate/bicarbonate transport system substrate-binding protein